MRRALQPRLTPIPVRAGIGLRAPHVARILVERPPIPWLEVHAESYLAAGGPAQDALDASRVDYPLSFHGAVCHLAPRTGWMKRTCAGSGRSSTAINRCSSPSTCPDATACLEDLLTRDLIVDLVRKEKTT